MQQGRWLKLPWTEDFDCQALKKKTKKTLKNKAAYCSSRPALSHSKHCSVVAFISLLQVVKWPDILQLYGDFLLRLQLKKRGQGRKLNLKDQTTQTKERSPSRSNASLKFPQLVNWCYETGKITGNPIWTYDLTQVWKCPSGARFSVTQPTRWQRLAADCFTGSIVVTPRFGGNRERGVAGQLYLTAAEQEVCDTINPGRPAIHTRPDKPPKLGV